jgi:hypothetical protein
MEYPVKLAFLYNFTKFVEWPADSYSDSRAPLEICVVGDDPFDRNLEGELRTRSAGGHPVEVRNMRSSGSLRKCHVVFVPVSEKDRASGIMKALDGSSALTVGDWEGFAEEGGIISLTIEEDKLHFEINPLAAERAGLKISSKLLALARIVKHQG